MSSNAAPARLAPAALRISTLALRFGLIFFLARYLPVDEVGLYGLLAATISYVLYPLGFDFYTHTTRQILRSGRKRWRTFLRSQLAFTLLLYAVLGPACLVLFAAGLLPWQLLAWFYLLVPLEHLGVELDRILIAMKDPVGASVGIFLRQAMVPLLLVPLLVLVPRFRDLDAVLATWAGFAIVGALVGWSFVRQHLSRSGAGTVDWAWIKVGVRLSIPFLVGTLCIRALFTVDRQIIKVLTDLETLGAYTLFVSIGAGMTSVVYAAVQQFAYPGLVESAHQERWDAFDGGLRTMLLQTFVLVLVVAGGVLLAEPLLLDFVGGGAYERSAWILPWVLVSTGLYNVSLVPHYGLYALGLDRTILIVTAASFLTFIATVAALARVDPVRSVLIGFGAACVVLTVGKSIAVHRGRGMARSQPLEKGLP